MQGSVISAWDMAGTQYIEAAHLINLILQVQAALFRVRSYRALLWAVGSHGRSWRETL